MKTALLLHSEPEVSVELTALAQAILADPAPLHSAAPEEGALALVTEADLFDFDRAAWEGPAALLLDGPGDWPLRYGAGGDAFAKQVEGFDLLFVHDPRSLALLEAISSRPAFWLGLPAAEHPLPHPRPAEGADGVLLLPAGNGEEAEEERRLARLWCAAAGGIRTVRAKREAKSGRLVIPADVFCAIGLDTLPRFGFERLELAAAGLPAIGTDRNAAQALLYPDLTVDPLFGGAGVKRALESLRHSPPARLARVEAARARRAELFSPAAVRRRFHEARQRLTRAPSERRETPCAH